MKVWELISWLENATAGKEIIILDGDAEVDVFRPLECEETDKHLHIIVKRELP